MDFCESFQSLHIAKTEASESLESKERREQELYLLLMKKHGLMFTPKISMRNERPVCFRCVFTAASDGGFELGLQRLRKFMDD